MWNHLRNSLTAASFILMLCAFAFWFHGYFALDTTGYFRNDWPDNGHLIRTRATLTSLQGAFYLELTKCDFDLSHLRQIHAGRLLLADQRIATPAIASWLTYSESFETHMETSEVIKKSLTMFSKDIPNDPCWSGGTITFPAWLPTLLLALLPLHWLDRRYRPRKSKPSAQRDNPNLVPAI